MSTKKIPVESYLRDAKALTRLFPSLAKYRRRKTLRPAEKAAIARARNVFEITQLPNEQRPKKYQHYTFPADRKRSTKSYIKSARQLESIDDTLKRFRGRKKLKPGEKARITYLEKRTRHVKHDLEPMTKTEMKKIKRISHSITFPIRGLSAIKLRHIPSRDTKNVTRYNREITNEGMTISVSYKSGEKRVFLFIYTGADIDKIKAASNYLTAIDDNGNSTSPNYLPFKRPAQQLAIWTNHGRTANGQPNTERLLAQLGDEQSLQDLAQSSTSLAANITSGGFAIVFGDPEGMAKDKIQDEIARKKYASEKALKAAIEGTFILGVIGIFVKHPK